MYLPMKTMAAVGYPSRQLIYDVCKKQRHAIEALVICLKLYLCNERFSKFVDVYIMNDLILNIPIKSTSLKVAWQSIKL